MKNRKWWIIGLCTIFILLTVLVKLNLITGFDTFMYEIITFNISDIFTTLYGVITFLGSTAFIIFLCAFFLIIFTLIKKRNIGLVISAVLIISTLVNNVLKLILQRPRPEVLAFVEEHSYSFPSGHTMAAVSMYGILFYIILKSNMNKKIKIVLNIILTLIPILVAISRVYLGAHFISDVIGAYLVSSILLLIETFYIEKKNLL